MSSANNMARRVNLKRKLQRPEDPRTLEFDLDADRIGPAFVKGDVRVGASRHIILATDYQLQLLRESHHWLVRQNKNIIYNINNINETCMPWRSY